MKVNEKYGFLCTGNCLATSDLAKFLCCPSPWARRRAPQTTQLLFGALKHSSSFTLHHKARHVPLLDVIEEPKKGNSIRLCPFTKIFTGDRHEDNIKIFRNAQIGDIFYLVSCTLYKGSTSTELGAPRMQVYHQNMCCMYELIMKIMTMVTISSPNSLWVVGLTGQAYDSSLTFFNHAAKFCQACHKRLGNNLGQRHSILYRCQSWILVEPLIL